MSILKIVAPLKLLIFASRFYLDYDMKLHEIYNYCYSMCEIDFVHKKEDMCEIKLKSIPIFKNNQKKGTS